MIVGVDMDEVIADLHGPWLRWISRRIPQPIPAFTHWNHPIELGQQFGFDAYEFWTLKPYEKLVEAMPMAKAAFDLIRQKGHTILVVSSCFNEESAEAKRTWLIRRDFIRNYSFFLAAKDKTNAPCHVLADDGPHNLVSFRGMRVLVDAPHNRAVDEAYFGGIRVRSLYEFAQLL